MNEDTELLYSLSVPCVEESQTVLEGLCEAFISGSESVSEETALILRLSVAEACRMALDQSNTCNSDPAVVTLRILKDRISVPDNLENLILEIEDPGPGLKIDDQMPPYPESMHGRFYSIHEILGQNIMARVEGDFSLSVHCLDEASTENLSRSHQIDKIDDTGLGLLAISRIWKSVNFTWNSDSGNLLRLKQPTLDSG